MLASVDKPESPRRQRGAKRQELQKSGDWGRGGDGEGDRWGRVSQESVYQTDR